MRVEKEYTLQTADGSKTLPELFHGHSQLLIYQFMFGPRYPAGCPVNSSIADTFDSLIPHLKARDVTLMAVAGAPIEKLQAYRERRGGSSTGRRATRAISTRTLASRAASSTRARRSRQFSTSLPPVAFRNAKATGTDIYGYLTELFGFTVFGLEEGPGRGREMAALDPPARRVRQRVSSPDR